MANGSDTSTPKGPSYLDSEAGLPGFNKAIISFWFRVPAASLQRLRENTTAGAPDPDSPPRLWDILPLMTFGELFDTTAIEVVALPESASYTSTGWVYEGGDIGWVKQTEEPEPILYSPGETTQNGPLNHINPSYIGIAYDQDSKIFYLRINLQTKDIGESKGISWTTSISIGEKNTGVVVGTDHLVDAMSAWTIDITRPEGHCLEDSTAPGNPWIVVLNHDDISDQQLKSSGPDAFTAGSTTLKIDPDHWHHVLLSFDVSSGCSATGGHTVSKLDCDNQSTITTAEASFSYPGKMWLALDDINYTGKELFGKISDSVVGTNWEDIKDLGPNDILSRYARLAYGSGDSDTHDTTWIDLGCIRELTQTGIPDTSYTFPANPLPSSAQPFGIPAAANMSDNLYQVEMAEFQMWLGKTIDTNMDGNRRVFVDKDGKPVPPKTAAEALIVQDGGSPNARPETLGQPDILLHGVGNWKEGRNTGALASVINTDDPNKKTFQFNPTPPINSWKPDPSLHGPQSPPPKT